MYLVATNPYLGGATFYVNYTNSDGVPGRTTNLAFSNSVTTIGSVVHSNVAAGLNYGTGPFLSLGKGDKGVRSVQSIAFQSPNGGLASLVLVRPLATILVRETTAHTEHDYFLNKLTAPQIHDGAYLNFLCSPNGSIAAVPVVGQLEVLWN